MRLTCNTTSRHSRYMVSDSTMEEMMHRYIVSLSASAAGSGVGGAGVSGSSPEDAHLVVVGGVGGAEGIWLVDSTLLPYTPGRQCYKYIP